MKSLARLVAVIILFALGFRASLFIGIAIPASFLAGILGLQVAGLTVNIVVLFSLILAVGMLVDDAIIVSEFAERRMSEGMPPREAYSLAAKRMAGPVTAATATRVAAFSPLLFWPGTVGDQGGGAELLPDVYVGDGRDHQCAPDCRGGASHCARCR